MSESTLVTQDHLALKATIARKRGIPADVKALVRELESSSHLSRLVLAAIPHLTGKTTNPDLARELLHRLRNSLVVESRLGLVQRHEDGRVTDHGIVAAKSDLITTAGVNFLVGILDGTNGTPTTEKYHALGTGTTAAAIGDTALQSEIAGADYSTGSRAVGTTTVGGSNNIYQTVATNTIATASQVITELGLMTASTGGTLIDHFVFAAINLSVGDSLQSSVAITYSAGG